MSMRSRVARLFTVKTRFEAFLVIYAIAVGAAERGLHYMNMLPGWPGMVFAVLCTGVVFIAGAKILDAVRAEQALEAATAKRLAARSMPARPRRRAFNQTRPRSRPLRYAAGSRSSPRRD